MLTNPDTKLTPRGGWNLATLRTSVKQILKRNSILTDIAAFIYSLPFILSNLNVIINGKLRIRGVFCRKMKIKLKGNNTVVEIMRYARLKNCTIHCIGDNCQVHIGGDKTIVHNSEFYTEDKFSSILIGNDFTMEGGHIAATEGWNIIIGDDCMFSNDIEIRNGDSHPIFDVNKSIRINKAKDVRIGNHVWLCAHSRVLKGSEIPDNTIIGNSSLVCGRLTESDCAYSGIPVKPIKRNITWKRHR